MEQEAKVQEVRSVKDIFLDTFYGYFDPVRDFFRNLAVRHYRVNYIFDNGMTMANGSRTFTAMHDREARRLARRLSGSDYFELEQYRPVKRK